MSKFESIDDFLSNRLSEGENAAFEKEVASDPSLKADVDLQRQIIEGVRHARKLELKSMLNNVPVGGSIGSGLTAAKIAASVITAAVIGTVVYFVIPEKKTNQTTPTQTEVSNVGKKSAAPEAESAETTPEKTGQKPVVNEQKTKIEVANNKKKEVVVKSEQKQQPKIEIVDPSEDMEDTKGTTESSSSTATHKSSNASRIAVDTDASNATYHFNYQFNGSKLLLYGPFDKSLYEILEINGGEKSVFLFYKDNYYLLSDKQNTITPLTPIRDQVLIKKLKEYRGQ